MELNIGDLVIPRHRSLPHSSRVAQSIYKILSLRGDGIIPNVIIKVDEEGNPISESQVEDLWKVWHNYTWTLYKAEKIIPLTEADKKYEKIILKIRKLDHKFQTRKESK